MIRVEFKEHSVVTVYGLTQYDFGQLLEITGVDIPDGTEIHFCQSGKAITQYIQKNQVLIPDHMLQYSDAVHAYLYKVEHESGETTRHIVLKIAAREKPGDYVIPEEPAYSRLLPIGGDDDQILCIKNGEYAWRNIGEEFASDDELKAISEQIPVPMTVQDILNICK